MKKFLNAVIVLIAFHSNNIISQDQDLEEVVVTSSFVNTTEVLNPIYTRSGFRRSCRHIIFCKYN